MEHLILFSCLCLFVPLSLQCGTGPSVSRGRVMKPMVLYERSPDVDEESIRGSGMFRRIVTRGSKEFADLVKNNNKDIVFDGVQANRLMTKRCSEKLNKLAILVKREWPNVKLRVIEAFDEHGQHPPNSLHYEARAVDLTISDRDKSKIGNLGSLAFLAGFDWVYFETTSYIHASVVSEKEVSLKSAECFPGAAQVKTQDRGTIKMEDLKTGDFVLTYEKRNGNFQPIYSEVLGFLDQNFDVRQSFIRIEMDNGHHLEATKFHLIYGAVENDKYDANNLHTKNNRSVICQKKNISTCQDNLDQFIRQTFQISDKLDAGGLKLSPKFDLKNEVPTPYNEKKQGAKPLSQEKIAPVFMRLLSTGDEIIHTAAGREAHLHQIRKVSKVMRKGAFAPLTERGSLIVDDVLVSCYAKVADEKIAHAAFAPFRLIAPCLSIKVRELLLSWYLKALVYANDILRIIEVY